MDNTIDNSNFQAAVLKLRANISYTVETGYTNIVTFGLNYTDYMIKEAVARVKGFDKRVRLYIFPRNPRWKYQQVGIIYVGDKNVKTKDD